MQRKIIQFEHLIGEESHFVGSSDDKNKIQFYADFSESENEFWIVGYIGGMEVERYNSRYIKWIEWDNS
jgi:hypothetical protein